MNNGFVNLKQKRRIKHTVTLLVAIAILIAMIIVTGVLYVFQLPPKNRKLTANDANLLQDEDTWKREVHAVFAINLVGPKNTRVRRSIENVKRFTLEVIRSLLITYYDSDAQFVIQSYSVTGNTTISDLCDAECTMKHINEIDQEPTFTSENPNQTDAVWQYYRYSLGKKPSLYILFVADRASYRDDALFAKDMEESSRALRETKLIERTETVLVDDINATDYFLYSIISDGTSASETASLINDRLISHYRNNDEMSASAGISSVIDSQENTAHIKSTNDEDDNSIDVQTIMATSTTAYRLNTGR
uniref:Uncharacterized protein n=1 Tax=Setaria digitata TaxID=48799 RepID=A0A915PVQ6_9BILA